MYHYHWGQFQSHVFHVVPFMGPITTVVTLCSAKLPVEQTSQLKTIVIQYLILAFLKTPNVTIRLVFQNQVTYNVL